MTFVSSVKKFGNSVRKAVKKTFFKVSKMTGRAGSYGVGSEGRGRDGNRRGVDPQELSRQVSSLAIDTPDEPAIGRLAYFSGRGMGMRGAPQRGQRSPTPSSGTSGTSQSEREIHLISNHFELRWVGGKEGPKKDGESFTVHQYHITFEPEDLPQHIRRKVLNLGLDQETNGPFVYDGGALLFSTDMVECGMILESVPESDNHYKATIAYTKAVPLDHPIYLQIYNLVVRKCLFGMGLDEIGKSYFDSAAVIDHPNLKIKLWPGYSTAVKPCEMGLLLCVDVTHKVIRNDDLLTHIRHLMSIYRDTESANLEEYILEHIRGSMIITPYNQKTYRVEGILLNSNPLCGFTMKNGQEVTFVEYYKQRYNGVILDLTQPMIVAATTQKGGRRIPEQKTIILVPEMCHMTGLTEAMRANNVIMKTLNKHLHMEPKERVEILNKFISKLSGTPNCQKTLNAWGFAFELQLKDCTMGRVLPNETIIFAENRSVRTDNNNDFTKALRSHQLLSCIPLERWVVFAPARDMDNARSFAMTMHKVATPLGFRIRKPASYESLQDVRVQGYMRSLETFIGQQSADSLQMVLCVLPNNKSELYYAIKKRLSQDIGISSQCLLAKNLTSKGAMSIATKLVIQMSAKLGGEPWTVQIPLSLRERCMTIGFDFYQKSLNAASPKTGALVGTLNDDHSRYFSVTFNYKNDELEQMLRQGIIRLLEEFQLRNHYLPTHVIFYHATIDEAHFTNGTIYKAAQNLCDEITKWYHGQSNSDFGFVYIGVTKQHNTRILTHRGSCGDGIPVAPAQMTNPPPGTILDKDIIAADGRGLEFYLVPTNARQGTVRPIHYRVILETTGVLSGEVIKAYTYKMCHLYYNWSGAVNVPSTCQYAGKLAKQAAYAMPSGPNSKLSPLLHYL
ncbi:unnamed protein product [Orchesella dallaii]|uniref:Piwi-like protein 1 n=2 Tax=Orchesella dallaii TaxID=48710 RepID=A0ABP1Q1G2_9HEXA